MKKSNNAYLDVKKRQALLTLVLTGAFAWGSFAFGYNPVVNLNEMLNK